MDAVIKKIDNQSGKLPLPHMGWNRVHQKNESRLFKNINNMEFYFSTHLTFVPILMRA